AMDWLGIGIWTGLAAGLGVVAILMICAGRGASSSGLFCRRSADAPMMNAANNLYYIAREGLRVSHAADNLNPWEVAVAVSARPISDEVRAASNAPAE